MEAAPDAELAIEWIKGYTVRRARAWTRQDYKALIVTFPLDRYTAVVEAATIRRWPRFPGVGLFSRMAQQ